MLPTRQKLILSIKNSLGWRTNRKLVIFSVDDYGNVRLASKRARMELIKAGLDLEKNRFDLYDALETSDDLVLLYDVLQSVKDKNSNPAKFTAYSLSANLDFEKVLSCRDNQYYYKLLPDVFSEIPGYEQTWQLWQEGIKLRLIEPQYHGREHLNIKYLKKGLEAKEPAVMACLKEHSWSGLPSLGFKHIDYATAFAFEEKCELDFVKRLALDGLSVFEKVFGCRATAFTAPGGYAHHYVEQYLSQGGITLVDTAFVKKEHQGGGQFQYKLNKSGKKNSAGQFALLRNCVFEPASTDYSDSVDRCMYEIAQAFSYGKPANISSHRVNFCGHIEPTNRAKGLRELKRLLHAITTKWPEAEFITVGELGELLSKDR